MNFKKFMTSLKGKLIAISIIPIIGLSVFMYFSLAASEDLGGLLEKDHELLIPNLTAYGEVMSQRLAVGYYALQAVANQKDPKERKESLGKMEKSYGHLVKAYEVTKKTKSSPEEDEIMKVADSHFGDFKAGIDNLFKLLAQNDPEKDKIVLQEVANGNWQVLAKELRLSVTKVLELYNKESDKVKVDQANLRSLVKKKLLAIFFIVIIFNTGVLIYTAISINKKLQNAIATLNHGAEKVGSTSKETAEISTELSSSVTEAASALQETTSSVEETSAMIKRNAENAKQSNVVAEKSKQAVDKGLINVEEMNDSIAAIAKSNNEILSQVEASNKEMQEIVNLITEIGNKTKLINDIVFQTKLLSFNASVEAARAGEQGKGFAVVAEEVGKLAIMSGESANEISSMLESSILKVRNIAQETRVKVDSLIASGKDKIQRGEKIAQECSDTLKEIHINVEKVNNLVLEISEASEEQATGMSEINKAMIELDHTSSLNNQISQKVSSSAEVLKVEVDSIRQVVEQLSETVNGVG